MNGLVEALLLGGLSKRIKDTPKSEKDSTQKTKEKNKP